MRSLFWFIVFFIVVSMCSNSAHGGTIMLTSLNTIVVRGSVNDDMVASVVTQASGKSDTMKYVYIDSDGGELEAGFRIIEFLRAIKGKKPLVCITPNAKSMAFSIFQFCDVRLITTYATLMQHLTSYGVRGDSKKNSSTITYIAQMSDVLNRNDAKRLRMSMAEFDQRISSDLWLFGLDIIKTHAADRVVQVVCSQEMAAQKDIVTVISKTHIITSTYSKCPIISEPLAVLTQPIPEPVKSK